MMIALRHPSGQLKQFYACDGCGRPRSFGSASLCRECYTAKAAANQYRKRFRVTLFNRRELRRKRIKELERRISKTFQYAEIRARKESEKQRHRALRKIDSDNRKALQATYSIDLKFDGSRNSRHDIIRDNQSPDPLRELILKEEREEEKRYDPNKRHRRLEVATTDFEDRRLYELVSKAPFSKLTKRGRGKRQSIITKYSPERGITQRHVKMGSQQFV